MVGICIFTFYIFSCSRMVVLVVKAVKTELVVVPVCLVLPEVVMALGLELDALVVGAVSSVLYLDVNSGFMNVHHGAQRRGRHQVSPVHLLQPGEMRKIINGRRRKKNNYFFTFLYLFFVFLIFFFCPNR